MTLITKSRPVPLRDDLNDQNVRSLRMYAQLVAGAFLQQKSIVKLPEEVFRFIEVSGGASSPVDRFDFEDSHFRRA